MSRCLYSREFVSGKEFQKIVHERIRERVNGTKERRQHELQRIHEKSSKIGVHPLQHFPKEIWEKILEPLGPRDLGNTLGVHDLFQDILGNRKIRDILLPQIVNLKFSPAPKPVPDHYDDNYDYYNDDGDENEERTSPSLWLPKFARLREVSRSLRNSIDKWFEDELMKNLRSEKQIEIPSFSCEFPGDEEDDPLDRWKLKLDGMLENLSNPETQFFLRSFQVIIAVDETEGGNFLESFMEFRTKISSVLALIGRQILRFEFKIVRLAFLEFCREVSVVVQLTVTLNEWMEFLPNLKWLVLNSSQKFQGYFPTRKIPNIFTFPHLKNLERISFAPNTWNYANIFRIFSQVIKANQQVKALDVFPLECIDRVFLPELKSLLESLPNLSLDMFSYNSVHKYKSVSEHLQPVISTKWPLQRLHLGLDNENSELKLKSLFQLLENFQNMEHLTLCITNVLYIDDIPFLKLPKLSHLELHVSVEHRIAFTPATNFFYSLQFLLFAKELKRIIWKMRMERRVIRKLRRFLTIRECHEQSINFRAGLRDVRSSNLWDCFPELENVEVEVQGKYRRKCVSVYKRGEKL